MRVLLLGASQNIGYFVAQRLLAKGHSCTLLLRRPDAMKSDAAMSDYIRDGKAKLVQGDGLVQEDIQRAWDTAKGDGEVGLVFFGIGGYPDFKLTKGFVLTPPDLTTRSMSLLLSVIQSSTTPTTRPKLITISSNGLDKRTQSLLPLPLKPLYGWALHHAHEDKVGLESNVQTAAGWSGNENWLGERNAVIIRPALYTNGECLGDKKADAYRTGEELKGAWTVSRADVGHFIVEKVVADWEKWAGKGWVIAY